MSLITLDDLLDLYLKGVQRGGAFLLSKLTFSKKARTLSAFNQESIQTSNWWMVPAVRRRWNALITGNPDLPYETYVVQRYFQERTGLRLLSLGSGNCSRELKIAQYDQFTEVLCVDIAENRLQEAETAARAANLHNIHFLCANVEEYDFPQEYFDVVLFNFSLHHFYNVDELLQKKVKKCLKNDGFVIINEYVGPNRLQFSQAQIKAINEALQLIDKPWRRRWKTRLTKNRYYGSGILRMIIADPSECVDSANILPALHRYFEVVEERPYGGNILMLALKDIAHHFVHPDARQQTILEALFQYEDEYLLGQASDLVFGIYQKSSGSYTTF